MAVRYYSPTELGLANVNLNAVATVPATTTKLPVEQFTHFLLVMVYSVLFGAAGRVQVRAGLYSAGQTPPITPALLGTRIPMGPSSQDWSGAAHTLDTGLTGGVANGQTATFRTETAAFGRRAATASALDSSPNNPNGCPVANPWPANFLDIAVQTSVVCGAGSILNVHLFAA